jgi:hypothetical protein
LNIGAHNWSPYKIKIDGIATSSETPLLHRPYAASDHTNTYEHAYDYTDTYRHADQYVDTYGHAYKHTYDYT